MSRLLTIDAGTTGVTALIVDEAGQVLARGYEEFPQHFPRPGWVEHDADEIWSATVQACEAALDEADVPASDLRAVGITNQRETGVLWERDGLAPVAKAIVWQDRRTAGRCDELREQGHLDTIRGRTGLVLDAYFTGTKLEWLLDHNDGAREAAEAGRLAAGTVDSWLVAKLSGGAAHVTEPGNASRTMLYDIREGAWSDELCELLRVPRGVLPEVRPTSGEFAHTDPDAFLGVSLPITGIAGDQQAALFGQACWQVGMSKNTYGTGSFVLATTGSDAPYTDNLLTTIAWDLDGEVTYALEGSIFITGAALQWLRDGLGLIQDASEAGPLAESVDDAGEVLFVPAFAGLGAPWWDPRARGTLVGLTRGTTKADVVRAAVEAMAYQTRDVIDAMQREGGIEIAELRVDGGASVMDVLCQFQSDLLGVDVLRPQNRETTALGAAFLAGLASGVWSSTDELAEVWQLDRRFSPAMDRAEADALQERWLQAVERARGWATD